MMSRRTALLASVGALAALGGAGGALWQTRRAPALLPWELRFPAPGGPELVLAELRGRPLLINFWATWCAPCVIEMPLLDRFQKAQPAHGFQVVGLAIDHEAAVRQFLASRPVSFRIGLAGPAGIELSRAFGNRDGGLPFTLAFDAAGRSIGQRLGALKQADLERWEAAAKDEDKAKKPPSA